MKENLHPSLAVHFNMHPYAEIRADGEQLYWEKDRGREQNSITFFSDDELPEAMKAAKFQNDVTFAGNLRFSCTR